MAVVASGARHTGQVNGALLTLLVALGGVLTISGALMLVRAFRLGQAGRPDDERRSFRLAVVGLALGSLAFLAATVGANG